MQTMEPKYDKVTRRAKALRHRIADVLSRATSISEACRMLDLNCHTLRKYCSIIGIPIELHGNRGRKKVILDEAKAAELWDLEVSAKEISEQLGVNVHTVYRWANETGRGKRGISIRRLQSKLSPRTQRIVELRCEGATLKAIGDEFGLTRERIRQILERYGPDMNMDRGFAETCIKLRARGYGWPQIQDMIGSELPEHEFLGKIQHLFTDEEKAKYFIG